MNKDDNKFEFGELLTINEEGYKFARAIGTTYSLDLKALIAVPVAFRFSGALDAESLKDPFQLFLSLKDTADKIDVFCQLGGISANTKSHRLYRFLERSIHEILIPEGKAFHPKLWVVRYEHDTLPARYKVIVLTRNLTFDSCWDMTVMMEGEVNPNPSKIDGKTNKPLSDFIEFLYTTSKRDVPKQFLDELLSVKFRPVGDDEFVDLKFYPLGILGSKTQIDFFTKGNFDCDEIVAVSPFVSDGIIKILKSRTKKLTLISRLDTFKKLDVSLLKDVSCFRINDQIVEGSSKLEAETEGASMEADPVISSENQLSDFKMPNDLHAKAFLFKYGAAYDLYIGSANATYNAHHGNIEFMVMLKGERRNSAQYFKDSFFSESEDFIIPYVPDPLLEIPPPDDLEKELDEAWRWMLSVLPLVKCEAVINDENDYDLILDTSSFPALEEGVSISIRPFHLQEDLAKSLSNSTAKLVFSHIDPADLSCFFIVELTIKSEKEISKAAVFKLPVSNMPENREEYVVRSLFKDKKNFFRLLRMLLSEDLVDAILGSVDEDEANAPGEGWSAYSGVDAPLFERLMKAASRDRKKLTDIDRIVSMFDQKEGSVHVVSDKEILEFLAMWKSFKMILENQPANV